MTAKKRIIGKCSLCGGPVDPHAAERFCCEMNGWVSHIRAAIRERTDNDA